MAQLINLNPMKTPLLCENLNPLTYCAGWQIAMWRGERWVELGTPWIRVC